MGQLVRFTLTAPGRTDEISAPPDDPLARSKWVHSVLCDELAAVRSDDSLSDEKRRDYVLKFTAKIVLATPHNELHAARQDLREKEKGKAQTTAGGTIKHGKASHSRSLRSGAPKRSKPKK